MYDAKALEDFQSQKRNEPNHDNSTKPKSSSLLHNRKEYIPYGIYPSIPEYSALLKDLLR